ncbi:MAG: helix-turn-helix transcriptional regulator [Myxococcales bacterium]|nr:helix-turn-helix transcriptional regulator [Myxococcales bacterium]
MASQEIQVDAVTLPAFALVDELPPFDGQWHSHQQHQVLYCTSGTLLLATGDRSWWLPPHRAAWIPAGVRHRASASGAVLLCTSYLQPAAFPQLDAIAAGEVARPVRVFAVTPLARALLMTARRWPADCTPDVRSAHLFQLMATLLPEWLDEELPFDLPTGRTEPMIRALAWAVTSIDTADATRAARIAAMSPRTFARRMKEETGDSWRAWLTNARMLIAMPFLADPNRSITDVGLSVGYESPAAFSFAFRRFSGQSPRAFRTLAVRQTAGSPSRRKIG